MQRVACFTLWMISWAFTWHSMVGRADESRGLTILPPKILLSTTEARQILVAQLKQGEQFLGQAAKDVVFTSADPKVLKIEDGVAIPVSNGTSTITATVGEAKATAEVTVTGQDQPFTWSFRNHVESV